MREPSLIEIVLALLTIACYAGSLYSNAVIRNDFLFYILLAISVILAITAGTIAEVKKRKEMRLRGFPL